MELLLALAGMASGAIGALGVIVWAATWLIVRRRREPAKARGPLILVAKVTLVVALLPWIPIAVFVARKSRLPPEMPAGRGWTLHERAVSVDAFRGESRYLRWRVKRPAGEVESELAQWVRGRGRWWTPSDGAAVAGRGSELELACARVPGRMDLFRFGSPVFLLGGHAPPADPAEPGVVCRVLGDPHEFWHGILARVRPVGEASCTVEIWLGAMQDL